MDVHVFPEYDATIYLPPSLTSSGIQLQAERIFGKPFYYGIVPASSHDCCNALAILWWEGELEFFSSFPPSINEFKINHRAII